MNSNNAWWIKYAFGVVETGICIYSAYVCVHICMYVCMCMCVYLCGSGKWKKWKQMIVDGVNRGKLFTEKSPMVVLIYDGWLSQLMLRIMLALLVSTNLYYLWYYPNFTHLYMGNIFGVQTWNFDEETDICSIALTILTSVTLANLRRLSFHANIWTFHLDSPFTNPFALLF